MNPGTFQGAGTGALGGSITRYTQTPVITTSQTIPLPNGVQRIEALLVGGGGGGVAPSEEPKEGEQQKQGATTEQPKSNKSIWWILAIVGGVYLLTRK